MEAVKVLRNEFIPMFNSQVQSAVTALVATPPGQVDENEFIDASRLVSQAGYYEDSEIHIEFEY